MSQEKVETVRRWLEALSGGSEDFDRALALVHRDVVLVPPGDQPPYRGAPEGWPEPGPFVGRDAVMRQFRQLRDTWSGDTAKPISDFSTAGDRVVVRVFWSGTGKGPESNVEFTIAYTVRKDRVYFIEYFWDHAEALEAAGLRE
jgi:ketosteroid isomerase-like protein